MPSSCEDPVVRSARREALVVLLIWLAAMVYTVGYCYVYGYDRPPETLTYILGFPDWVVWGILAPWAVCLLLSYWFGYVFVRDTALGPNPAGDNREASDV
jgi:hypothetical protein